MNKMVDALFNICHLEELARREVWLNNIDPLVKLMITLMYIIFVASVGKYELAHLLLYGVYPILMVSMGELPLQIILPKLVVPVLAGASLGILNPYFDPHLIWMTKTVEISAGWLSLLTLFVKSIFSVLGALILVSTTKVEDIAASLERLKIPKIVTIQFLIMFRYITLLVNELERTLTAYSLRAAGRTAIAYKTWGPLVGQLFIRTSERSFNVYESMKLRGFNGQLIHPRTRGYQRQDVLYAVFWGVLLMILRFVEMPSF